MFLLPILPILKAIKYWYYSGITFSASGGRQDESISSIAKALSYILRLSTGVHTHLKRHRSKYHSMWVNTLCDAYGGATAPSNSSEEENSSLHD